MLKHLLTTVLEVHDRVLTHLLIKVLEVQGRALRHLLITALRVYGRPIHCQTPANQAGASEILTLQWPHKGRGEENVCRPAVGVDWRCSYTG